MHHPARHLPFFVFLTCCGAVAAQERPSSQQIGQWVRQLDHDRFSVREAASAALSTAGPGVIEPLRKAAAEGGLEVVVRAVRILTDLALGDDEKAAQAATTALERLAKPRLTAASARAAAALGRLADIRKQRALERLFALGAKHGTGNNTSTGAAVESHLVFNRAWRGGDDALALLRRLPEIDYVSIHGSPVTDDSLPHLKTLKQLNKLELYGANISDEGLKQLRDALPTTEVDYRRGGLLGVSGSITALDCRFTRVRENSAAAKAGLQVGDIVVECEGKKVSNFKSLTDIISTKRGGEKISMEVLRGGRRIKAEVTLGAWGQP